MTGSDEANSEADDLTELVDITVPGFTNLRYLHATTEERLYTLLGTTSAGTRKRIRFASGQHGRARLRLRHELNVLNLLKDFNVPHIPQLEKVETLPDRGICAIYPYVPMRTFQEYSDDIKAMEWDKRLGGILQFAKSLATTLSEAHLAGIFRTILNRH